MGRPRTHRSSENTRRVAARLSIYPFDVAEHPRDSRNAPGPFYVVQNQCISCGAPQAEAPGLVTLDDGGCYFHKQPETDAEVNDAIRSMLVSCIEVYRYGG